MGYVNRYDASAGPLAVNLPALSGLNVSARVMLQKYKLDASANTVTFSRAGSDQFDDGSTALTLTGSGESRTLQVVSISGVKRWKVMESMTTGTVVSGGGGGGGGSDTVLNVKDYGALGDGVTDDSGAFRDAFTAAIAGSINTFSYTGNYRTVHTIYIPAGTYIIKDNAAFLPNPAISRTVGLKWFGDGVEASMIVFSPPADNGYLCDNEDDFQWLTFEDMTFHCAGSKAATATWMKSDSDGGAQNYVFRRVNWTGTWKYGLDLTGSNNNGELTWYSCGIHGTWTDFLHVGASDTSDQFVNYNFYGCNVEYTAGDFIDMAKGGNVNVWGGGFIHTGNGTETTSAAQCFFRFSGNSHSAGTCRLYVEGVRIEHRHQNSQLINCGWGTGSVSFVSCDSSSHQYVLTTPTNVVQAEFGSGTASMPEIVFDNCSVMGKHTYHYNVSSWNHTHRVQYRNCEVQSFLEAVDFVNYVNDGATGNIAGKPAITFTQCRSGLASDYKESFDTTVGWAETVNAVVSPKVLSIRPANGYFLETSTSTWNATLPLNSVITRVRCFKGAGGSSTATNVTYTLTDAGSTTIATAGTGGSAWNTSWAYDSGLLRYVCSTDNKRTLTLTSANISESTTDTFFLIEYLA